MPNIIKFKRIHNQNIFRSGFEDLDENGNGEIIFKDIPYATGGIAVVYAPNGTGKTSLTNVLEQTTSSANYDFSAEYNQIEILPSNKAFHIIKDQIKRNIIPGETSDYLIGADIKREYELRDLVSKGFNDAFTKTFPDRLKNDFKVIRKTDVLLDNVKHMNSDAAFFIEQIVNKQNRGKNIDRDEFISFVRSTSKIHISETIDEVKRNFVVSDYGSEKIIHKLLNIDFESLIVNNEVEQIEQDDDAINIIGKYCNVDHCIVCDNPNYDAHEMLEQKKANRKRIYENLDDKTKALLDSIVGSRVLNMDDPFKIKERVLSFIAGDIDNINDLLSEFRLYRDSLSAEIINALIDIFEGTEMIDSYSEYKNLQDNIPAISSEELLFIKEVIDTNIEANISIERDTENDRNFKLMLNGRPFIGEDTESLHLSTGEQNFISLAFEFLLARHSNKEFVVIDDPISSFDSVYKNKIAFCILKFLDNKKQIILTHNTDLIRLLEVQLNGSFNLYMLVNSEDSDNGFIRVKEEEKKILINMYELIKLFRNDDNELIEIVKNQKQFLMSMIPFMRGYAHISVNGDSYYTRLSEIMHGYTSAQENISDIYMNLFGYQFSEEIITTEDIINIDCDELDIIDKNKYPLLAETLRQTLIYYHLRMKVEKKLVEKFNININPNKPLTLNQLINKAFRSAEGMNDDMNRRNIEYKVFFTSRKTLINEFNHFEGNMNIFQPAIDITPNALACEVNKIEERLLSLDLDFT